MGLVEIVALLSTYLTTALVMSLALNVDAVIPFVLVLLAEVTRRLELHWVIQMARFVCTRPRLSVRLFLAWLTQKPAHETPAAIAHLTE